ncbi:TPA: hypothetical protein ACOEAR_001606 [Enterobacter ludwigii]
MSWLRSPGGTRHHTNKACLKIREGTMHFINGSVRDYRQIKVEDAQFLFDIYGDETACDGDTKIATQFVHLDADFEAIKKCDS